MNKRILLYELGKLLLIALLLGSIWMIVVNANWIVWYSIQLVLSRAPADFILTMADNMSEEMRHFPVHVLFFNFELDLPGILHFLFRGMTGEEAKALMLRRAMILTGAAASLLLARWLLRQLEYAFKKRFMPTVLQDWFTDIRYSARKKASSDEPLCRLGLLYSVERYYTANRLEGIYRSCWVAAEELICGGVYLNHYSSHRVKVRGQWLTVRLDRDFEGMVLLESVGTENHLSKQRIARRMSRIEFDEPAFRERFRAYGTTPEIAQELITAELQRTLLGLLQDYPDLCVVFENGFVHFLVRRRSFDRRWDYLIPFNLPWLRKVANRVYGPLMDVTDALLDEPQNDGA